MFLSSYDPNPNFAGDLDYEPPKGNHVDWVAKGAVTPVKNQGQCKADYAFGAVGCVEGEKFIFYPPLVEYSVQMVVDCSLSFENKGCDGGSMHNTNKYLIIHGISSPIQD